MRNCQWNLFVISGVAFHAISSNKSTLIGKQEKTIFLDLLSNMQMKYNAHFFGATHQLTRIYTKSPKMYRHTFVIRLKYSKIVFLLLTFEKTLTKLTVSRP